MKTKNGFATVCLLAMTLNAISQVPGSMAFTIASCNTNDGGIICGGYDFEHGNTDYRVVYLDEYGNTRWDRTYGGDHEDELSTIHATSDGGFLLGGRSNSGISGQKSQPVVGDHDFWVVKIDKRGEVEWDRTYGGNAKDNLVAIAELPDGMLVFAGYSDSRMSLFDRGGYDYMVVWTDASGNLLDQDRFGQQGKDILTTLALLSDRSLLLGGYSQTQNGKEFNLVKIDQNGDPAWNMKPGDADGEFLHGEIAIEETDNGGFMVQSTNETTTRTMKFNRDGHRTREENVAQNLFPKEGN